MDLNYGGKLSGRIGRWNIGTLAIRQDEFEDIAASNVFVGRVTANVLAESALGIIVTDGDPNSSLDNGLSGVDFRYLNSRLPGGRVLEADAWFQQSEHGRHRRRRQGVRHRRADAEQLGLRGSFGIKQIEANFNPALGFVNRRTCAIPRRHWVTRATRAANSCSRSTRASTRNASSCSTAACRRRSSSPDSSNWRATPATISRSATSLRRKRLRNRSRSTRTRRARS